MDDECEPAGLLVGVKRSFKEHKNNTQTYLALTACKAKHAQCLEDICELYLPTVAKMTRFLTKFDQIQLELIAEEKKQEGDMTRASMRQRFFK